MNYNIKIDLTIIIVSYNTKRFLKQCLESVFNNIKNLEYECFVVDNNSNDGSSQMVKRNFPKVKLIENKTNIGFAKANNQALTRSRGRYVLLLNSDTIVLNNIFRKMIEFMDEHPDAGVIGPCLLNQNRTLQHSCRRFMTLSNEIFPLIPILNRFPSKRTNSKYFEPGFYNEVQKVDYVCGASLMIRNRVLQEIGFLDEHFFMYCEEQDLCYRLKKRGWNVYYFPNARVIHYGGESFQGQTNKKYRRWYESKYKFIKKHRGIMIACWYIVLLTLALLSRIIIYGVAYLFINNNKRRSARQIVMGDLAILKLFLFDIF